MAFDLTLEISLDANAKFILVIKVANLAKLGFFEPPTGEINFLLVLILCDELLLLLIYEADPSLSYTSILTNLGILYLLNGLLLPSPAFAVVIFVGRDTFTIDVICEGRVLCD